MPLYLKGDMQIVAYCSDPENQPQNYIIFSIFLGGMFRHYETHTDYKYMVTSYFQYKLI